MLKTLSVRWFDGYYEQFTASEIRNGGYMLWCKLPDSQERWIPLTQVRWFSTGGVVNA